MKKEKNKWLYAFKIIFSLTILSLLIAFLLSFFIGDDLESLDGNVALIDISGTIVAEQGSDFLFEDVTSSDEITQLIRKANENEKIKAIIFRINSPGGSAVASEEIANEIKKVNKTTVAWIREVGASGAYWAASATDHIIASRMSITGSVGVLASYLEFSGFLEEHNISYESLTAGELKDMGNPFKKLTERERAIIQKSLDTMHEYFIEDVAESRNLNKNSIEEIKTGLYYIGSEAKDLGLVDELGGRDEVINYVQNKIDEEAKIVEYKKPKGFFDSLSQVMNEKSFYVGKGIGSSIFTRAKLADTIGIST